MENNENLNKDLGNEEVADGQMSLEDVGVDVGEPQKEEVPMPLPLDDLDEDSGNPELDEEPVPVPVEDTQKIDVHEVQQVSSQPSQEDTEEEDDEEYEDSEGNGVLNKILTAVIIVLALGLVGFGGYSVYNVLHKTTPSTSVTSTLETEEPEETADPDELTFFQEQQVYSAVKLKLQELYINGEYVVPSDEQMDISGKPESLTVKFPLTVKDNTQDASMIVNLDTDTNIATVTKVNIAEVQEETQSPTQEVTSTQEEVSTPTPEATKTPETVKNGVGAVELKQTYEVEVNNSVTATVKIEGEGQAYVAAAKDGTVYEIARVNSAGENTSTVSLEPGTYQLRLYASSGSHYSWSYTTN